MAGRVRGTWSEMLRGRGAGVEVDDEKEDDEEGDEGERERAGAEEPAALALGDFGPPSDAAAGVQHDVGA
jgi:hypothetical protein